MDNIGDFTCLWCVLKGTKEAFVVLGTDEREVLVNVLRVTGIRA